MNLLILELLAGCIAILCFSMQAQVQDRPHVTGYSVDGYISENPDDARGRMVAANIALGVVQYRINALGQRVQKLGAAGNTVFHYDNGGRVIAESDGQNWKEYVYLGDTPIAVLTQ